MGDNSLKSHGVDLKFSREKDFSGYFSVNLEAPEIFSSEQIQQAPAKSGQSPQAYLTHPRMTEEKLFEALTKKKLDPNEKYHHPTLSRDFEGGEFAKAYQEMIKDYTKNFSDGLTKLVCESFDLGDETVDITEVTGLSIRMNLGDRVAVLNFSEHWGKFLDRNLAPGISLRRIILALRKEKNPDKALELLKNTEEFRRFANQPQHTNIASLPAEEQVKSFLRYYLDSNLPGYIRDFILEKLNKDLLFNQRTATDIIQIFSHSNTTPFVLRIEFTKIGAINFLQRRSYVDIPSTDFEALKLTPLSEKVTELFTQDQIASMSQVACYVMAWLLTEYRVAKKRGQPFADGEALRFLDALNELYEHHKKLAELGQQNLPQGQQGFNLTKEHTKNVFVWLRHLLLYDVRGSGEVASSRHEFREDLVRNFLRLLTPGYILERGQDQYLAVSLGVKDGVNEHVTALFQRDIEENEIGNLLRDRLLSLRGQNLQNSVRGDVLVAVRDGANMQSSGSQVSLHVYGAKLEGNLNERRNTIINSLGLRTLLNWRLDGSVIEQLKNVDQERLENALSPGVNDRQVDPIFNSLPQNVKAAYQRIRINLGQGNRTFEDFIQQGAQLANDDERIQDLISVVPSLRELIDPTRRPRAVLTGSIIYDPLTGFRLQQ